MQNTICFAYHFLSEYKTKYINIRVIYTIYIRLKLYKLESKIANCPSFFCTQAARTASFTFRY